MGIPAKTYMAILLGAVLWCSALVVTPLLAGSSFGLMSYSFFHTICHQIDQRSFDVFGQPLAVCSRCSAIYFAFLVGTLLYPFVRSIRNPVLPPRWLLVVALVPLLFDVFTGFVGLREVTNTTRTLSGMFFGLIIPFVIIPIAGEAAQQLHRTYWGRKEMHNA